MNNMISITIVLTLLGLALGSFAGATVWRLRARQLKADKKHGDAVSAAEKKQVAKLKDDPLHKDRSVCLHCGHTLQWYDLIPLVSWVSLRGKCRYCHKSIGWFEPLMEIGVALFFVVSYLYWPYGLTSPIEITHFILWLVAGVGMAILFAYDAKWFLLPNIVVFPLIGLGALRVLLAYADSGFSLTVLMDAFFSCVVLSGLYYLIYIFSRHQWVGFGDVKLGLALALFLADWQLAFLALFLANLIGTVIFLPLMAAKKIKRQSHVPFGPLLILGWAITGVFGKYILDWYLTITLGL